jgi:gluconate 2-dehydrogenase gamma chain
VTTRRSFLHDLAGVGAGFLIVDPAGLEDALAHAARALQSQPRPAFKVLTADEARDLDAVTSRIVPTTDTPGAREAGVVFFIDHALSTFQKDAIQDLRAGLADLTKRAASRRRGAGSFAALSTTEQDAVLVSAEGEEYFGLLTFLTFMGMFGEPSFGGNRNEVGWKLLNFNPHGPHKPPFGHYDAQVTR